jgi:uncharacterized protein (AIM24 family)
MAFCVTCGSPLPDTGRFCTNCGTPISGATGDPSVAVQQRLDYTIQGDNLQMIRIKLQPGQELFAEAGKNGLQADPGGLGDAHDRRDAGRKNLGRRKAQAYGRIALYDIFSCFVPGEVGFAGSYPGRVQAFDLKAGQGIFVQRDAFVVAQSSVTLNIALVKRLGAGFFGGEGFILEQLTGPGTVFIHAGGDFVEFTLAAGESLQVDTGCIVAFDETVDYDIQLAGGIRTAIFGGEGLFLATLTGPGRVIIQSLTLEKMRRELAPYRTGGDEHNGLNVISSIFNDDD